MERARCDLNARPLRASAHYSSLRVDRRLGPVRSAALSVFRSNIDLRYGPNFSGSGLVVITIASLTEQLSLQVGMDWKSFTEFFEGDGAVSIRLGRAKESNVLQISVVIGQKWRPKLEQINSFFREMGIDSGRIYLQKYGYTLRVFRISAVKTILANMLPYSFLKREQIRAAMDYLDGKITGDQVIEVFNHEYDSGKRRTRPPAVSVPFTKLQLRIPRQASTSLRDSEWPAQLTRPSRTQSRVPSSSS